MKHVLITQVLGGLFLAAAVVACGDDDNGGSSGSGGSAGDNGQATGGSTSSTGGSTSSTGGNTSSTGGEGGDGGGDEPTACETYCSGDEGLLELCSEELDEDMPFEDEDDCLEQCEEQTNWDLSCRNLHRGFVLTLGADPHCQHAIGLAGSCADN